MLILLELLLQVNFSPLILSCKIRKKGGIEIKIGITSTVPVEVVYASGNIPVDLNNLLVQSTDAEKRITQAESFGYPDTCCAWIKGIFSVARSLNLRTILGVVGGDCSNTLALLETLEEEGIKIISFSYPHNQDYSSLKKEIENLMSRLGTNWKEVIRWKKYLDGIRKKVRLVDEVTYSKNIVSSWENHYFQVSCSDFWGDPPDFEKKLDYFLRKLTKRSSFQEKARLGYVGVPPFLNNLYLEIEKMGARVVFNEVQRQFAMPCLEEDLVTQYLNYTYPYSIFGRIKDIKKEISRREIEGIIHYTQSFCHRSIQDIVLRKHLRLPLLKIEGGDDPYLSAKDKTQIEAFLDLIAKLNPKFQ